MRHLSRYLTAGAIFLGTNLFGQSVIPLVNESATGQLGITVQLGDNSTPYTYILDTGSAGFFTAHGNTSAWEHTIDSISSETFHVGYGTGGLQYDGNVAHTKVTFQTTTGSLTVDNVRMGIITNQPYPDWNEKINHVDGNGQAAPIAPEPNSDVTHLFFGTMGAGLYQTQAEGGSLSSVIGQIPLAPGLTKGFIIHTGGAASTSPTLTVGLTEAAIAAFPIQVKMSLSTGTITNDNGTDVTLYPEAQTTATYTILKGSLTYEATANLIMDTGGLGTHITTGTDINPGDEFLDPAHTALAEGESFSVTIPGEAGAEGLAWITDPTGTTKFVDQIQVVAGSGPGSLNSGIALFYQYDVMFDTENGIIGLRPLTVPEPAALGLVGLALGGLIVALRRRRA